MSAWSDHSANGVLTTHIDQYTSNPKKCPLSVGYSILKEDLPTRAIAPSFFLGHWTYLLFP